MQSHNLYSGHVNFPQAFNGIAPNAKGVLPPYMVTQGARATVTEPNHIIDEGLTYRFYHWFAADLDYRYSRFTSDAVGNFNSLFNGTTSTSTATDVVWRDGISDLRLSLGFTPLMGLLIRPGFHLLKPNSQ